MTQLPIPSYGSFNGSSERPDVPALATRDEQFPEPRPGRIDLLLPHEEGHTFNHFFPWTMRQDGSALETLAHIGHHELHGDFERSFDDDSNLQEFICDEGSCRRFHRHAISNLPQIRESATAP